MCVCTEAFSTLVALTALRATIQHLEWPGAPTFPLARKWRVSTLHYIATILQPRISDFVEISSVCTCNVVVVVVVAYRSSRGTCTFTSHAGELSSGIAYED